MAEVNELGYVFGKAAIGPPPPLKEQKKISKVTYKGYVVREIPEQEKINFAKEDIEHLDRVMELGRLYVPFWNENRELILGKIEALKFIPTVYQRFKRTYDEIQEYAQRVQAEKFNELFIGVTSYKAKVFKLFSNFKFSLLLSSLYQIGSSYSIFWELSLREISKYFKNGLFQFKYIGQFIKDQPTLDKIFLSFLK